MYGSGDQMAKDPEDDDNDERSDLQRDLEDSLWDSTSGNEEDE